MKKIIVSLLTVFSLTGSLYAAEAFLPGEETLRILELLEGPTDAFKSTLEERASDFSFVSILLQNIEKLQAEKLQLIHANFAELNKTLLKAQKIVLETEMSNRFDSAENYIKWSFVYFYLYIKVNHFAGFRILHTELDNDATPYQIWHKGGNLGEARNMTERASNDLFNKAHELTSHIFYAKAKVVEAAADKKMDGIRKNLGLENLTKQTIGKSREQAPTLISLSTLLVLYQSTFNREAQAYSAAAFGAISLLVKQNLPGDGSRGTAQTTVSDSIYKNSWDKSGVKRNPYVQQAREIFALQIPE